MAYTHKPTYFFNEETRHWEPIRVQVTGEIELDMPWSLRPLIRAKRFHQELVTPREEHATRRVVDYARVHETMTFATKDASAVNGRGPDVVLTKGRVVEVLAPSPYDQVDIDRKKEKGIQLVTILWRERTRMVHASMLAHSSAGAFKSQPPE